MFLKIGIAALAITMIVWDQFPFAGPAFHLDRGVLFAGLVYLIVVLSYVLGHQSD